MPPSEFDGGSEIRVFSGRRSILPHCDLLQQFAQRCGQAACMHGLPYFIDEEERTGKLAYLVLRTAPGSPTDHLAASDLLGAAVLFEYRPFHRATGMFVALDLDGLRTVIAPSQSRYEMATIASAALIKRGAQLVIASFTGASQDDGKADGTPDRPDPFGRKRVFVATRERQVEHHLTIEATYKSTLATLGKRTRYNLGYYRRRLLASYNCEFVPDASALRTPAEQKNFNERSLNPIPTGRFQRTWRATSPPEGFLCGLRTSSGQWLSFIGGWRQGGTTLLQWQANAAGFEKFSLTTAMRAFFLEHEVELGTKALILPGGTPHSLTRSFEREPVIDLLVRRRTMRAAILVATVRGFLSSTDEDQSRGSFLAEMLFSPELEWRAAGPGRGSTTDGRPSLVTRAASSWLRAVATRLMRSGSVSRRSETPRIK